MDRRDALKKLGVGGAVAVSAPVLLDSFKVASASSTAMPPRDNAILASVTGTVGLGVEISLDTTQFPPDTTFAWQVTQSQFGSVVPTPTTGSTVVVDRPNTTQPVGTFTVVLTATSPTVAPTGVQYQLVWNGTSLQVG